jgi:hypothetical protein
LLYGQQVDMKDKLGNAESQLKRRQAKIAKAQAIMDDECARPWERLEAEADKLEAEASVETWNLNLRAAQDELATIEALMAELKPMCKHYNDDILVMSEASQEDEWLGELKKRAENFLLTAGTIPHDHFDTMRMHPRFKAELVPFINDFSARISAKPMQTLMLELDTQPLLLSNEGA